MTIRSQKPIAVFLGHHKCATSWVNTILEDVSRRLGLKFVTVWHADSFSHKLPEFIAQNQIDVLSYSNAKIEYVRPLQNYRAFHVIRDPRDLIVSAYFSHLNSHPTAGWPELEIHRDRLRSKPKDEGLFIEMGFSTPELEDLGQWDYHLPDVMEIKMEELIINPYDRLLEAMAFLGLAEDRVRDRSLRRELKAAAANRLHAATRGLFPAPAKPAALPLTEFLTIVYDNRFAAKASGRKPGDEDVNSHYRKGVAGDWVNHLNAEHRQYFKRSFGDLLQKLGYEKSTDW